MNWTDLNIRVHLLHSFDYEGFLSSFFFKVWSYLEKKKHSGNCKNSADIKEVFPTAELDNITSCGITEGSWHRT